MSVLAVVLACLACTGHGRRMQRAFGHRQGSIGEVSAADALAALLLASDPSAAWQVPGAGVHHPSQSHHRRFALESPVVRSARSLQMKKGSKTKKMRPADGFDQYSKKRMMQMDKDASEWVEILLDGELGNETGATKAVEAGVSPQGQDYLWTVCRGDPAGTEYEDLSEQKSVFCLDGNCRVCVFPLFNGEVGREEDGTYSISCGLCGTKYSLETGEVIDFLPAKNPVQWIQKNLNGKKDPKEMKAGMLPTRISKSGRVRVRLPDGTLVRGKTFPAGPTTA
mmetsp:Transcript_119215/g.210826  ORF Transcript_119215/g.210826 Transcript_119215/m.210826 type:complete len:281 (+) Transcript_119215:64-906(+)